jgi:hypothetical protein
MKPEIVRWSFKNIHMPMIHVGNGDLVCTSKQIEIGLGVPKDRLHQAYRNHKDEMDSLRCVKNIPKDFLLKNKTELGIERVKKDMLLWTEDAMINFAFFIRTPLAASFRQEIRSFIKEHRRIHVAGIEQSQKELRQEFDAFKEFVNAAIPSLDKAASLAGSVLQAQKDTKHLRLIAN